MANPEYAQKLISDWTINSFANCPVGKAKHTAMTDDDGACPPLITLAAFPGVIRAIIYGNLNFICFTVNYKEFLC